jgi:hypothetical protein
MTTAPAASRSRERPVGAEPMRSFIPSRYAEGIVWQDYRRARLVVDSDTAWARRHGNFRPAAARFPEMNVLVYHADFDPRVAEEPLEAKTSPASMTKTACSGHRFDRHGRPQH